jgi:hypothetical protein
MSLLQIGNMFKLVICQVEADGEHGFLHTTLVLLLDLGIHNRKWSFLGSVHNVLNIHGCQQHFDFKLPKVELPSNELVNDTSGLALK